MKKLFDWKRFWCKQNGIIRLDDSGFLFAPELKEKTYWNKDIVSFNEITELKCLILLGEPGIGKSIVLENEYANLKRVSTGKILVYKNLNEFGNEIRLINEVFNSDEINNWLHSDKDLILFLDSFDECLIEIKKLTAIIKNQFLIFKNISSRLYIRISCRTGYWPVSLSDFFNNYFEKDSFEVYELAPLRRLDVENAAKSVGINSAKFIQEIISKEIQTLAINPLTLEFLIKEFQINNCFSSSKELLFNNGCKILCTEPNNDRVYIYNSETLSPERRVALASRIAAVMIFCNKSIIDLNILPNNQENILTLDTLLEGEESTDDYSFTFTQYDLKETITQTALFSSRGDLRFGFSHLALTEFLAAKYIANHQLEIEQIKSLITISSDNEGKIIPQIKGTAAWLSIISTSLTDFTIKNDPQNLLYGDIENLNNKYKKDLVESLLKKFNENTIGDLDWGLHKQYKKLSHPNLSEQIRPYIENRGTNFLARRTAINIAEACNLIPLNDLLLKIALDKSEETYIRSNAVRALITIGDQKTRNQLIPLVNKNLEEDKDDELKGCVLRALWPDILSTKDVFKILTPPKRNNYTGSYVFFMFLLDIDIIKNDLDACIDWVLEYCSNSKDNHYQYEHIEDSIIYCSWNNIDLISNKSLFAKILLKRIEEFNTIFPTPFNFKITIEPLKVTDDSRITMLKEIVNIIDIEEIHQLSYNGLVSDKEFEIVFNQFILEKNSELKIKWAKLLSYLFLYEPRKIDLILTNIEYNKELKEIFHTWVETIEIDSQVAKMLKENWQKHLMWKKNNEERNKKKEETKINVLGRILRDLDEFEHNKISNLWSQLFMDLTLSESSINYGDELNSDITTLPGWSIIDEVTKKRIVDLSKVYIQDYNENKDTWFGKNTFKRPVIAGYKSLMLLMKLEPSYIENLDSRYWKNWMYILIDYPESYGIAGKSITYLDVINIAYKKIPDEIVSVLLSIIENINKSKDEPHLFVLNKVDACMDKKMQDALLKTIKNGTLKPLAQHYIFNKLFEKNNDEAVSLALDLISKTTGYLKIEITKSLANYCNKDKWDSIINIIKTDSDFGKEFFLSFIDNHFHNVQSLLERISEKQCALLFLWLSDNFPKEEDPVFDGAHTVGSRENIGAFRDQILSFLSNLGTKPSIEALNIIKKEKPHFNIDFYLVEAKNNYRKTIWEPLNPKDLLLLTNNRKARVILNSNDLLNLIIESLKRIETVLQGDNALSILLWDKIPSKKGKYKPKPELVLSDYIKHFFEHDLKSYGISSYREVQLRKPNKVDGGKDGENADIYVSFTHQKNKESFNVIIEIKGSWNPGINSSMESQLLNRYLKAGNCVHGLYLVGWYNCDAYHKQTNKTSAASIIEAKDFYEKESTKHTSDDKTIRSFVLDCSLRN